MICPVIQPEFSSAGIARSAGGRGSLTERSLGICAEARDRLIDGHRACADAEDRLS